LNIPSSVGKPASRAVTFDDLVFEKAVAGKMRKRLFVGGSNACHSAPNFSIEIAQEQLTNLVKSL